MTRLGGSPSKNLFVLALVLLAGLVVFVLAALRRAREPILSSSGRGASSAWGSV
ncbi:hypothetical protein AB0L41_49085 [Amycolatopsis mediterranei]|uniref:hypothetical protein n=1 Tax=Amycolatopsis mediterranei TaxID=33910 RepID=UPI0034445893